VKDDWDVGNITVVNAAKIMSMTTCSSTHHTSSFTCLINDITCVYQSLAQERYEKKAKEQQKMTMHLEGNQVNFGAAFFGAGALHCAFRNDVKLVPLFALGDDVLALGERLFH